MGDDLSSFRAPRVLRLTTFGGVSLRDDGVPHTGGASQRRRIALLVLVAAAGPRAVSRDKLLGYLWPDSDTERGRHALRQALHAIQQAVAREHLFVGTTTLQLDPSVMTSDVYELAEAHESGAHQRVAALYKGTFLDGFHVPDAPEFDRWADAQRAVYAGVHTTSLETLARDCAARGDQTGAIAWWRRLAAEHPVSARYAVALMRALADAGDRTGALQFFGVHTAVVREELGTDPDADVVALRDALRAGVVDSPPRPAAATSTPTTGVRIGGGAASAEARDRQLGWLQRAVGARYDIDVRKPLSATGGGDGYEAYDRSHNVAVDIHVVGANMGSLADLDTLDAQLGRLTTLDSAHVARLLEHGVADGVVYYVTARPNGPSLRDHLARERQLPVPDALSIARGVASALAHAHERGVLHGDLRPKHVHVTPNGAVVAGLGIAEALRRATTRDRTSATIRMGSPAYQSPEQLTGDSASIDARADVYSLGCILFEMLTGEVPYASPNPVNMLNAKFTAPVPSVIARRASVTPMLEAVVQRCLGRSPSDRYRSGVDLHNALIGVPNMPP